MIKEVAHPVAIRAEEIVTIATLNQREVRALPEAKEEEVEVEAGQILIRDRRVTVIVTVRAMLMLLQPALESSQVSHQLLH